MGAEGLNKVIICGYLGQNPELIDASGTSILRMSVGVNEQYKDRQGKWKDKTTWIPVSVLGKRAEALSKFVRKGMLVVAEGRLNPRSYKGKDGSRRYTIDVQANIKFSVYSVGGKEGPKEVMPEPSGDDVPPPPDDEDMPF
jgi:single-strand DNA-binding protein